MISIHRYEDAALVLNAILQNSSNPQADRELARGLLSDCYLKLGRQSVQELSRLEGATSLPDAIRARMEKLNSQRNTRSECLVCGDFVPLRFKMYRQNGIRGRICLLCDDLYTQKESERQTLLRNRVRAAIGDLTLAEYYGDTTVTDTLDTLRKKATNLKIEIPGSTFWVIKAGNLETPQLIEALDQPDAMVRTAAAQALGRTGKTGSCALPSLIRAMTDPVEQVRNSAATAVHTIAPHGWTGLQEAGAAITLLKQVYLEGSAESAALAGVELQRAAPEMMQQLSLRKRGRILYRTGLICLMLLLLYGANLTRLYFQDDPETLHRLHDLGWLSTQRMADRLLLQLDGNNHQAMEATTYLSTLEPEWSSVANSPDTVQALIGALSSEAPRVRLYAANALGHISSTSPQSLVPLARLAVHDPNPKIRLAAGASLAAAGPLVARALPVLVASLLSEPVTVRAAAIRAVAGLGIHGQDAAQALSLTLTDREASIRAASASALGKLPSKADMSLVPLTAALNDPKTRVRIAVVGALGNFRQSAEPAVEQLLPHLAAPGESESEATLAALSAIRPDWQTLPATEPLMEKWTQALGDRDRDVAEASARALNLTGDPSLPFFKRALDDPRPLARKLATDAFANRGEASVDVMPKLLLLLQDSHWEVRQSAARTLGTMDRHADLAVKGLVRLVNDPYFNVQEAALISLEQIGADAVEAVPALEAMIPGEKPVRQERLRKTIELIED